VPEPLITESLRTLSEDQTREMVVDVLGMPEIREATRELIGHVTDGTIDALSEQSRADRLTEVSEQFVLRISTALASMLERDVGPAMVRTLSRGLDTSLRRILSEETQSQIGVAVARVAQQSTAALAVAVRDELGPAMRAAWENDVAPALRSELTNPETQLVIADTSRTMSRGVILGIQDAFEEIDARKGRAPDTILTRLQEAAGAGFGVLQWGLVVLLIALLVLFGFLVRATAQARKHEAEAYRREAAIVALTEAIKSTESKSWSPELLDLLKASFRDSEHAAYIRDILRRNRHLRVTRPEQGSEKREGPEGGPGTFEPAGA
jgi:hypothetical protein